MLLVLLSASACTRVGEPRPISAAPSVESGAAEATEPAVGVLGSLRSSLAPVEISARPSPSAAVESGAASTAGSVAVVAPREVTETVALSGAATVRAEPRVDAPALGQVALGGRVDVYERVEGSGCARSWLAIAPRGFVCAPFERTREEATPVLPELRDGAQIPGVYGSVAKGAFVYDSLAAVDLELGRVPASHLTVRRERTVIRGERSLWKTRYGLIDQQDIKRFRGSTFHGEMLEDGLTQPMAWTLPAPTEHEVRVQEAPAADSAVVAKLRARRARRVLEERDGFVRVQEGWIARERVRVARAAEAPAEVVAGERWLDIDLSEQVLVAYEGAVPVYATLISSGRPGHRTPTGVFRISKKVAERTMNSMSDSSDSYSVDRVPWTAYFAHGYALHAAFWHGGFGRTRSHGCVNLAPVDARALYDWMAPLSAPGWAEVYGHEDQPGSLVRLHDGSDDQPQWKGYAKDMREAADGRLAAAAVASAEQAG